MGHDTVTQVLATHTGGPYTNQIQSIPISEYTNMCNSKSILLHPSYNSEFMVLLLFSYLNLVVGKYKVKKKNARKNYFHTYSFIVENTKENQIELKLVKKLWIFKWSESILIHANFKRSKENFMCIQWFKATYQGKYMNWGTAA